jgi:hypothetical protein
MPRAIREVHRYARIGMVDACVEMNTLRALAHPHRPQKRAPRRGTVFPLELHLPVRQRGNPGQPGCIHR